MKKILLLMLLSTSVLAQTKAGADVDEWAEVAQNAIREGTAVDISGDYAAMLHIDISLSSTTAHTGTKIEVQLSSHASSDEDWTTFMAFIGPTGTANDEAVTGTENAGATTIECASTLGTYDDDEVHWIFFENGTAANSEMGLVVSHVANTSVTVQDGITNAQTSATMWDIARRYTIELPFAALRVRVIYDNTFDSDGATVFTHSRIVQVTAL